LTSQCSFQHHDIVKERLSLYEYFALRRLQYFQLSISCELNLVDAIKFVADRTERPDSFEPQRISVDNTDFRLYKLLKNDSRFFRITDANSLARASQLSLRQQSDRDACV